MIASSAPNLSFLFIISFTLSFSIFSSYSSERLLINSVKAASYINSSGVSLSFFKSSDHFDYSSNPNIQSQSGFAKDPNGAREYLGLFFLSPPYSSLSLSLSVLFFVTFTSSFFFSFFSNLALFLLSLAASSDSFF